MSDPAERAEDSGPDGKAGDFPHIRRPIARLIPGLALIAGLVLGLWNLGGWMMNDDEGTYLYAAWRTGLGEIPYRDFTVVQTPLALAATGALFRLTGPSLFAARALSLLCVLGAAVLLYRAARFRLRLPAGMALAAAGIFFLNKHVFFLARSFMPDNLMLLCAAAALGAMLRAESGRGRVLRSAVSPQHSNEKNAGLTGNHDPAAVSPLRCGSQTQDQASKRAAFLAGLFSGLAALAKLNGAILLVGYGAYLGLGLIRRKTRCDAWANAWRAAAGFGLGFGLPFGLMLALVPETLRYTLGFHAAGGAEAGYSAALVAERLGKLIGNHNYGLFLPAFAGIWVLLRRPGRDKLLVATAAAACLPILLPGKYYLRYVLPAFLPLALLFAVGMKAAFHRRRGRAAILVVAAVPILLGLGPTLNTAKLGARDTGTPDLVRVVAEATQPGQAVFGDDPFINFLAGRPCPPRLVDVSGAMVRSGWVTAAGIEAQCEAAGVALIFVERGASAHHLAALPDGAAFQAYLDRSFRLLRTVKREFLDVDVYVRVRSSGWGSGLKI